MTEAPQLGCMMQFESPSAKKKKRKKRQGQCRLHLIVFLLFLTSMPVLVSQWMEGSSHLSQENAATAFPHTVERSVILKNYVVVIR
jgi:hypothetical protein